MSEPMLDVSSNNHPNGAAIDWDKVFEAGYRAVMVKCSEGTTYKNPWRAPDSRGALAAGIQHIGFYHFAIPSVGSAAAQAEFAISVCAGLPRSIGIALDLEKMGGLAPGQLMTFAENFLARLAQEDIGSPIYQNPAWLKMLPASPFGHKLWLADWGVGTKPSQYGPLWAWQSANNTVVPGVPNPCDTGTFYG